MLLRIDPLSFDILKFIPINEQSRRWVNRDEGLLHPIGTAQCLSPRAQEDRYLLIHPRTKRWLRLHQTITHRNRTLLRHLPHLHHLRFRQVCAGQPAHHTILSDTTRQQHLRTAQICLCLYERQQHRLNSTLQRFVYLLLVITQQDARSGNQYAYQMG